MLYCTRVSVFLQSLLDLTLLLCLHLQDIGDLLISRFTWQVFCGPAHRSGQA